MRGRSDAARHQILDTGGTMNLDHRKNLMTNRKVLNFSFMVYWRHYGR